MSNNPLDDTVPDGFCIACGCPTYQGICERVIRRMRSIREDRQRDPLTWLHPDDEIL